MTGRVARMRPPLVSLPGAISGEARWSLAAQLLTSGANFLSSVLLARALGLEGFGRYALCFLTMMVLRNLLAAVVLTPLSLIAPRLRPRSLPGFRSFGMLGAAVFGTLAAVAIGAGCGLLARVEPYGWLGDVALPLALANLAANLADTLRRQLLIFERARATLGLDLVRFGLQIAALALLADRMTVALALGLGAAASLGGVAYGLTRIGPFGHRPRLSGALWRRLWRIARWSLPATLLETVQGNGPLFLAGAVLGDSALGLLRAVQQVTNLLALPFNALGQIAPSMAARALRLGGRRALHRQLLSMTAGAAGALAVASVALIAAWGPILSGAMGLAAPEALHLVVLCAVLNFVVLLRLPLTTWCLAHDRTRRVAGATAIGAVCALTLSALLLPRIGASAAILGQIGGALSAAGVTALRALRAEGAR